MREIFLFLFLILCSDRCWSAPQYYCTAANSLYFRPLINLIGSIHKSNYENLEEIAVFDLGMTEEEKAALKKISKVSVYSIQEKNPDLLKEFKVPTQTKIYLGWYAWKPVVIKESLEKFPYVLWIDAGCTVLKPLDRLFEYIEREGYFLCTSGDELKPNDSQSFQHPVGWGATSFVKAKFFLNEIPNRWLLEQETVMGGLIGVARRSQKLFLEDWVELTKDIRHFADDGTTPDGWGTCRHDQTLLSILSYKKNLKIHQKDYTQVFPINVGSDRLKIPFYLTWNRKYVDDKTCIHIQSGLYQFEENIKAIHTL